MAQFGSPQLATAASKPQPLVLSLALLPIRAKVVERIESGVHVKLKELLLDNVALVQQLQETNTSGEAPGHPSSLRDVRDSLILVT